MLSRNPAYSISITLAAILPLGNFSHPLALPSGHEPPLPLPQTLQHQAAFRSDLCWVLGRKSPPREGKEGRGSREGKERREGREASGPSPRSLRNFCLVRVSREKPSK